MFKEYKKYCYNPGIIPNHPGRIITVEGNDFTTLFMNNEMLIYIGFLNSLLVFYKKFYTNFNDKIIYHDNISIYTFTLANKNK